MQYDLSEEQVLLRDMVRKLAKEKVEPGAAARDQKGEFSWEMVEAAPGKRPLRGGFPRRIRRERGRASFP